MNILGYITKKFFASFQSVQLDVQGSDCGSKGYREVFLTESNKHEFMYRYILDGKKLVVLDDTTMGKYMNKTVYMRSALYCTTDKLCNKCAGDLYYKLGIKNIGLTTTKIGSILLNLSMKSFHDSTSKISEIDINTMLI